MSSVFVVADDFGGVIGMLNNDQAYVLVKQLEEKKNQDGSYKLNVRAAFIKGDIEELKQYKNGQELPGRIIVKESTSPPPKGAGSYTHRTNSKGKEIFGVCVYTEDDLEQDSIIE